ncbi:hypothetical protein NC99_46830 [Sunxiuqinia dokdonensis]|uniref:Uncharacterized protein n=1 Tax=Sunxiuqinia dokdonensis TaxID=1409788 RepID=A0A0L8V271_9BACT|nr:hypothetical protein NC99_46830 [Sunxiuqinia dokdonensis]
MNFNHHLGWKYFTSSLPAKSGIDFNMKIRHQFQVACAKKKYS